MGDQIIQAKLYRGELSPIDGAGACEKAAALAGARPLYILAYTPDFYGFVTLQDGALAPLEGPKRDKFRAADVFELRCFCEGFELRWRRDDRAGMAVIIYEEDLNGAPLGGEYGPELLKDMSKRPGRYVLWGKEQGGRLFEHRVGELALPADVKAPPRGRVYLNVVEYFQEDRYGNLRWHSERLSGFSPVAPKA